MIKRLNPRYPGSGPWVQLALLVDIPQLLVAMVCFLGLGTKRGRYGKAYADSDRHDQSQSTDKNPCDTPKAATINPNSE